MDDQYYMGFALSLARTVAGQTSPNPPVGAVVVKDNQIVGFGAHLKAGEPHAEVHALRMAGDKGKGASIYVTLEPCSHYGKTPPCAELLVRTGVKRVVIATTDPNEKVAGKGIDLLKDAGIEVELGVMKEEADFINEQFFHYIQEKSPYVTLKSATSLDGKIATVTGESKWITGEKAREDVHKYRHTHDAILVGVNTVIKDNPSLTTRLPLGGKNPIRIILDTQLRTPIDATVIASNEAETWIVVGSEVKKDKIEEYLVYKHVQIIQLAQPNIEIKEMLQQLASRNIMSLFVEGGAQVHGSFLKAKAVNQVITYIAPKLIGGRNAPTSIGGEGFQSITDSIQLEIKLMERLGEDLKIVSVPKAE
ncbi:bifunctional diaminohydroxyphosphoribosylaminopyrimidine deaminase/5-amino-6-(5-phosphoribosylamino)uracil reductase RibD [Salirhabdus sp. Marseille-P4669]|uniref:bifunctional diaminohydroxyphosphoribosylaminopyrimidine deaminase/5-amino-6-(5-phosphoribosylamino)uracil reductase RibD n=1 Tax=Salirhabdus sp. Marseille-P4669 TaxID=2042310 RepID=UPI001F013ADA|nr:bifunctional diaminohydroxyphosphoribosylaminopyrimidine deaminase/5-amino-6-(5-phosphoribosylamino)uracil reductase RibD [Salirhabdus sp. Marseille-P4669]